MNSKSSKEQHLLIFSYIINVFTGTFDQSNASLMKESIRVFNKASHYYSLRWDSLQQLRTEVELSEAS